MNMNMDDVSTTQTLTDNFFSLEISQRDSIYGKSYFDEVNSKLLFEQLKETDDSKDDLALVTPEDPTILLTVVVESLLALLKYDVLNGSKNTLKDIKPGDAVGLIENREMYPAIFEGTELMNGKPFYRVRQPNGITTKIPPGREWRIQPYSSAESLSPRRKTTVYGKSLEHMLELPVGGLKAFQKSKMLVVAPDKNRLITAIRDVKVGGDPLEAVFPIADYLSPDDWHYVGSFGLNNLKQEPLIGLVANCDAAVDIAMKDPNYKLLLIDGASKLRAHYGSIELLNADETPRKVLCLLRPTDEDEMITLNSMGIESYVWKRDDFKSIELEAEDKADNPFRQHEQILYNLSGSDPVYREVPLPTHLEAAIDEAYKLLRSLSRKVPSLPESGILIRWGISLLNSWLQLPLTIEDYDSYLKESGPTTKLLGDKFTDFKNRIRSSYGLFIPSMNKDECEDMISKLEIIYGYFLTNNPKKDQLLSIVGRNTDDTFYIYCCQSGYTSAFNGIYGSNTRQAKNIEQLSVTPVGKAIVTGWSSRRNTAHGFLAPVRDMTFLLYRKELDSLRYIYKTHPASPESSYDMNARIALGINKVIPTDIPADNQKEESIESILEYVSSKFNTPLYPNYEANEDNKPDIIEAQQILFEDGSVVYADTDHKFDKIDRSARRIQRSKTVELTEGDEIVFADSERSMFEELLSILQKSEEYRKLSAVANIWREALQNYVEENNVTDKDLVTMFKMVGCPRTIHTIRSWLKGNVIGPSYDNYSAISAIAKITKSTNLETNHDEVIRACKTLHALHVKTGWLLVRNIINSAIEPEDNEDINDETRERLQAYSGSAKLKIIKAISDETFSVPVGEIGHLQEAYL